MHPKVGVLMGGMSAEREVSLASGQAVVRALQAKGYDVIPLDIDHSAPRQITSAGIDIAFLALHGKGGEDGSIQGLLETLEIPYTGSGILASAVAMHKTTTKRLLLSEGIPTPRFLTLDSEAVTPDTVKQHIDTISRNLGMPVVIKAPTQGSTIGITFAHNEDEIVSGLKTAFRYGKEALIEEYITGPEVTVALLGNQDPTVLPLIEIVSATGVYDYHAKYTAGQSTHIIPPRLSNVDQEKMAATARLVFKLLGCRGLGRVDFILGPQGPVVLEVNTLPGMTELSLFPDAARAAGIEFGDLCIKILNLAMEK